MRLCFFIGIFFVYFGSSIYAQNVCSGSQVIPMRDGKCNESKWITVFRDDFDSNALNLNKWKIAKSVVRDPFHFHSKNWYSANNVIIDNGKLKLRALKESLPDTCFEIWMPETKQMQRFCNSYHYTSGEINSRFMFSYGKFEIRCKIPSGRGFWPAFWLYGEADGTNNEIDVFEFWDDNTERINTTVHHNGKMCLAKKKMLDFSKDFHTFTLVWEPYEIAIYVDGERIRHSPRFYSLHGQSLNCQNIHAYTPYIRDDVYPTSPMNIMLNLALQNGEFSPNAGTRFPQDYEVEYASYSKRHECYGLERVTSQNVSDNNYNVIMGTTVKLAEDFELKANQHLKIIARDTLILGHGFAVHPEAVFEYEINKNICPNIPEGVNTRTGETDDQLYGTVYPNPFSNNLSISLVYMPKGEYFVEVFTIHGKKILSGLAMRESFLQIDTSLWQPGVYFLRIVNREGKSLFVRRAIKM